MYLQCTDKCLSIDDDVQIDYMLSITNQLGAELFTNDKKGKLKCVGKGPSDT